MTGRDKVMEISEYYTDRTPGSVIEKKEVCLIWRYDVEFAKWQSATRCLFLFVNEWILFS